MSKVKKIFNGLKWQGFHIITIIVMVAIVVWGTWDAYHHQYLIGEDKPITLEYLIGFLVMITVIYIFMWRMVNQEKQIAIQIQKEIDNRFTTAVSLLSSNQVSARIATIYSLYQHAVEHEKYRKQIVQVLFSHIRSKTQMDHYKKRHKDRPSSEIQTTIDLLFKERENKGLYPQFGQALPNANLSYAYCVGADFMEAHCQGGDFMKSHCVGADFRGANFQGAKFMEAHCQGASFWAAHCEGASFERAHCQGAKFLGAHCQGADFLETHCEGADFREANFQGANFLRAHFQGADFEGAHSLEDRKDRNIELNKAMLIEGALSQQSINAIEKAEPYCSLRWDYRMKKIIEENKNKKEKYGIPDGIVFERLEDGE